MSFASILAASLSAAHHKSASSVRAYGQRSMFNQSDVERYERKLANVTIELEDLRSNSLKNDVRERESLILILEQLSDLYRRMIHLLRHLEAN